MSENAMCPECGTKLVKKQFVDSWNPKGEPMDVNEDLYCANCKARICVENVDPEDFLENWDYAKHALRLKADRAGYKNADCRNGLAGTREV